MSLGIGTDSKLNNTALKNLSEVLRKYVDNAADLELQSLFAVQALVTHRQHPKGRTMFFSILLATVSMIITKQIVVDK
jgi:hypothetical protein